MGYQISGMKDDDSNMDDLYKKRMKVSVPWTMQLYSPMLRGK